MYRKLAESRENVLGYHVSGTITEAEIKEIQRELESTVRTHGKARLLIEIGDMSLPEPRAVWQDLKLTPRYLTDVERFAVVGNERWQQWVGKLTDLLARGEARHFDSSELPRAWEWLLPGD